MSGIKLHAAEYWNYSIYEKADRVGGTWRENTYPGLAFADVMREPDFEAYDMVA